MKGRIDGEKNGKGLAKRIKRAKERRQGRRKDGERELRSLLEDGW